MKILFLKWNSFGQQDIEEAFISLGHEIITFSFDCHTERHNPDFEESLSTNIKLISPDFVFSFNYFVPVSRVCNELNVKYVSWIFDSPYVQLYSTTVINPCNYIFVFDQNLYNEFHINRINTVYYLPLASNAKRLLNAFPKDASRKNIISPKGNVSFVGAMYTEKAQFYSRLEHISEHTRGFLEAIMEAQQKVYGMSFIQDALPSNIIEDMSQDLPLYPASDGVETREYLFAQYVINREITARERLSFLTQISQNHLVDLYTNDDSFKLPNCINHGYIDPYSEAPYVYQNSKINLNITLRSISSGIPLRAFEIMGSGGFLLTNYQADFDDCYVANEDYVFYDSSEDMMSKIEYYLSHDKERNEIAENGFEKTLREHSFRDRVAAIFDIIC